MLQTRSRVKKSEVLLWKRWLHYRSKLAFSYLGHAEIVITFSFYGAGCVVHYILIYPIASGTKRHFPIYVPPPPNFTKTVFPFSQAYYQRTPVWVIPADTFSGVEKGLRLSSGRI